MSRLKIIVVDDHALFRAGLKMLLASQPDMEIIGEADSAEKGIVLARTLSPDIALVDINLPGRDGLEATKQIVQGYPKIKVIILSMYDTKEYLEKALQAGVSGYVPKKAADIELIAAIRAVQRGEVYIHSSFTRNFLEDVHGEKGQAEELWDQSRILSQRELEVLKLLALGYSYQDIATRLFLSAKTVETYRNRLMNKLNLESRAQLIKFALNHGLLKPEP